VKIDPVAVTMYSKIFINYNNTAHVSRPRVKFGTEDSYAVSLIIHANRSSKTHTVDLLTCVNESFPSHVLHVLQRTKYVYALGCMSVNLLHSDH
jgi:hypothetical protein